MLRQSIVSIGRHVLRTQQPSRIIRALPSNAAGPMLLKRNFFARSTVCRSDVDKQLSLDHGKIVADLSELLAEEEHDLKGQMLESENNMFLEQTGLRSRLHDNGIMELRGEKSGVRLFVTFDTTFTDEIVDEDEHDDEENDEEEYGEEEEEEEEEGEEQYETIENEPEEEYNELYSSQNEAYYVARRQLTIILAKPNSSSGIICNCNAGQDGRLYVETFCSADVSDVDQESLTISSTDKPNCTTEGVRFDEMPSAFQDRFYDYLDTLGLDDTLATFVQETVEKNKLNSDLEDLSKLRAFLTA